jgi:MFS family permease
MGTQGRQVGGGLAETLACPQTSPRILSERSSKRCGERAAAAADQADPPKIDWRESLARRKPVSDLVAIPATDAAASSASPEAPRAARLRALVLLSLAELAGMSLWFSASAVVPALRSEWHLSDSAVSWLTLAVQIGFVVGTLVSAMLNLPDVLSVRHLFAASALLGAVTNVAFALLARGAVSGIALRFATGFFLAGVYPPGMKIMATWFRKGRGMALGVLVGALTLGKASPYLLNTLEGEDWRLKLLLVAGAAAVGGWIVLGLVGDGPHTPAAAPFDFRQIASVFHNRGVRLANFGYFGHMWELYAMWTWAPALLRASLALRGGDPALAEMASFLVLGAGAIGCAVGGVLADRIGRTAVAGGAMAISAGCCLIVGFFYGAPAGMLLTVMLLWGATVVADSPQFSASVTELADPRYMGTALTVQTCIGFLITTLSIRMIPALVASIGWKFAFAFLAPGPLLGLVAMIRLRGLPEAVRLAQGRR